MATRRLFYLLRGIRTSSPFNAGCSNRLIPSSLPSKGSSDFRSNTSHTRWRLIAAVLFSGQAAVFLMKENKFAFAQDDSRLSSNELTGENVQAQGQNQEAHISDLKRVKDGTVELNEHIAKWRLYDDTRRDLYLKGKLDEAEKASELALKEAKLGFGQRDRRVGFAYSYLAEFKRFRKEYEVAEPLYLEAISILEESLGPDDIQILYNLGAIYLAQEKLDQARKCYERYVKVHYLSLWIFIEIREGRNYTRCRMLSHSMPGCLHMVLYRQGKNKDAEAHLRASISILEILLKSNRPADAENLQRKILHALKLSKSLDSLETAKTAEDLALTLQSLGYLKESEELLEKCLEVRKRILSEDHIQVATTMLHLARSTLYGLRSVSLANDMYSDAKDDLIKAKKLLDSSIRITKATLRKEKYKISSIHEALLLLLQALDAVILLESKKHEMLSPEGTAEYPYEAERALRECISIFNERHIRRVLLNAPDAKIKYVTCLNRLSILIGESEDETARTKQLKDLIEKAKHSVLLQFLCLRRSILGGSSEINFSFSFYFWR